MAVKGEKAEYLCGNSEQEWLDGEPEVKIKAQRHSDFRKLKTYECLIIFT